jgi:DNA-binding transcriptional LysR family regulator
MITKRTRALEDLSVFVRVAEHASFVRAARHLRIPATNVSRAVARLEDDLGVKLLRRTSRSVALTDEGQTLLTHASAHLEGLEEALLEAAERRPMLSGVVRVTAPAFTGSTRVCEALADFALANPGVTVELDASNIVHDLIAEGFDFAIRTSSTAHLGYVAQRLWQGQFGLFAAPDFVTRSLAGNTVVTRTVLETTSCVVLRASARWRFVAPNAQELEIAPRTRFAVNDPRAAVQAARTGLGIVLAPLDAVTSEGLVALTTDFGKPVPVTLFVQYPTRHLQPRRVRAAIEWLKQPCYG